MSFRSRKGGGDRDRPKVETVSDGLAMVGKPWNVQVLKLALGGCDSSLVTQVWVELGVFWNGSFVLVILQ